MCLETMIHGSSPSRAESFHDREGSLNNMLFFRFGQKIWAITELGCQKTCPTGLPSDVVLRIERLMLKLRQLQQYSTTKVQVNIKCLHNMLWQFHHKTMSDFVWNEFFV